MRLIKHISFATAFLFATVLVISAFIVLFSYTGY